jgi:hypothetical protein
MTRLSVLPPPGQTWKKAVKPYTDCPAEGKHNPRAARRQLTQRLKGVAQARQPNPNLCDEAFEDRLGAPDRSLCRRDRCAPSNHPRSSRWGHVAEVDVSDMEWGRDVANASIDMVAPDAMQNMAVEVSHAQLRNKILNTIKKRGEITHRNLYASINSSTRSKRYLRSGQYLVGHR